jgi:hypothetical protein
MQMMTCWNCKAQLFISDTREPKCGKCGAAIKVKTPWWKRLFLRGSGPKQDARSAAPPTRVRRHGTVPQEPAAANLKEKIDRLARKSWSTQEEVAATPLVLDGRKLHGLAYEQVVAAILAHVRMAASRLNVPAMTPRVTVEVLCDAAGQFVEEDGWVKISVGKNFFDNMPAALAILCHEVCHYVLLASGIRERDRLENERLTDTAMFVFGLGGVFLSGYQQRAGTEYRAGHRLGYLTDAEYQYVEAYVSALRASPTFLAATEAELEARLRAVVFEADARQRLIAFEQKKYPGKSRSALIQAVLEQIEKDNR